MFDSLGSELSDEALDGVSGGGIFGRVLSEVQKALEEIFSGEDPMQTSDDQKDNNPTLKFR